MKYKGLFSRNLGRKRNMIKHKENGLCTRCSREIVEDRVLCKYHLEYYRKKSKMYSVKYQEEVKNSSIPKGI